MRLYTKRGDDGRTDLLGERVTKDDPRIELLGDLDEATSQLGVARAAVESEWVRELLIGVQRDLYALMAELAFVTDVRPEGYTVTPEAVERVERQTDELGEAIELPRAFILPGETVPSAALDVARTVIRRAERRAVALAHAGGITNPLILAYLNRLSSLLFLAARYVEAEAGVIPMRAKQTEQ